MGVFGKLIGGAVGSAGGAALGRRLGGKTGAKIGGQIGKIGGTIAGGLVPFKKGGMVKKTGPIYAHKGELVVPANMVKDVSATVKRKIRYNNKKKI